MKIMMGPRKRLTEGKGIVRVWCLSLYITDKHAVTIGADYHYRNAEKLAQEIVANSNGVITFEMEPKQREFLCAGCNQKVEEDDLFYYSNPVEMIADTNDVFLRHWIFVEGKEPVVCGPVTGYTGFLTDTEAEFVSVPGSEPIATNDETLLEKDEETSSIDIEDERR